MAETVAAIVTSTSVEGGLTPELLGEICPVARSDRREHRELFAELLSEEAAKDDPVFYAALLARIRSDHAYLRRFSSHFFHSGPEKNKRKSFGIRALRWLHQRVGADVDPDEILDLGDDFFKDHSPEREVYVLCRAIFRTTTTDDRADEAGRAVEAADAGWQTVRGRMIAKLEALDAPDPERAIEIQTEAEALSAACIAATERAGQEARLAPLRQDMIDRFSQLRTIDEAAALVDRIATAEISELEAIMAALEGPLSLHQAFLRADQAFADKRTEYQSAQKTEDWNKISGVTSELAALNEGRERTRSALRDALAAAQMLFEAEPQAEAELEPGQMETGATDDAPESKPLMSAGPTPTIIPTLGKIGSSAPERNVEAELASEIDSIASEMRSSDSAKPAPQDTTDGTAHEVAENPLNLPTVWAGSQPLDDLLAGYLVSGEYVLAWHLADLAEERGFTPALPPAVLKALATAPAVDGPYDAAAQRMSEALADAMAAVKKLEASEEETAIERARAIAFAALLRPALLAPDTTARVHLAQLTMPSRLSACGSLRAALAGLGRDFYATANDLAELAGAERERRLPGAAAALRAWLDQARSAQSVHAPTHVIVHQLLAQQGVIGHVIEGALAEELGAPQAVNNLVKELSDRVAQEQLIAQCEKEMGRPRRDRIRGMALGWACRKLRDGCERLQDWAAAERAERRRLDDRRRLALQRRIGTVRSALAESGLVDDTEGRGIDGAVAHVVTGALGTLRRLIEGREVVLAPPRLPEVLDFPLLRLPGGCQPQTQQLDDSGFAEERAAQRTKLFEVLQEPALLAADERAAFGRRCAEGAVLPARRLLDRLKQMQVLSPNESEAFEQALAEAEVVARRRAQEEVEALRLELATLYNLDLGTGDEVRKWLDRLDLITTALAPAAAGAGRSVLLPAVDGVRDASIPPDFPELQALLTDIRSFRDRLRIRIVEDQRARLDRLIQDRPQQAEVARMLANTLSAHDPVTAEDMIAQLQAGLPLASENAAERDPFIGFFPGFVESVTGAAPEALNRGLIDAALKGAGAIGPLDFSLLDADARRGAGQLLERWRRAENAMKPTSVDRDALRQLMEAVGFTSVSVTGDNVLIPGRLRRFQMRTDLLVAERWFLPPVFGSEAGGRYPVFLAHPVVAVDQLATELSKAGRESPCLLLIFGRLSRKRREEFASRMRRDKQSVLMIDETQIFFLATGSADRLERLITCAAPFGYLQPYTTNAGNIPREMFFGRRDEIDKIISRRSDGCLVYGGRQLGKSALLHHVRKLYDSPNSGARALYLKIDVIGAHGTPASQIWHEVHSLLVAEGIGEKGQGAADSVIMTIRSWLDEDPARRLLLLLDETDAFLAAESRGGFPNLGRLKDLMEETARRFKIVFAGLHNVRRLAQAPNSPLVHLGDPICVGPLNTSAESSAAARRLVTEPMRAAGYDYVVPELGWDILARVNHYPSLVQVFCKALLEGLSNQFRPSGEGPRWRLARGQIFEGTSAQEINRQIRERFQWTLNLDPRYELIAKVLAWYRLVRPDGDAAALRTGLSVQEMATETAEWWPKGFDRLGPDDFRALLDEMVDLGVLARYGAQQNRFGLRSAQVAQMLGRRDEIEDQIIRIHEKEPKVDYDAGQYHRRIMLDNAIRRSPLPDRQLADLFDSRTSGTRILAAAPALWGTDIAEQLRDLASDWQDDRGRFSAVLHAGLVSGIRNLFERGRAERHIVILTAGSGWDEQTIDWLSRQSAVKAGKVLPICLASPAWLAAHRLSGKSLPARIFAPKPWGEAMLRAWLEEFGLASLDERSLRERLLTGTGGAPLLLEAARPMLDGIVAAGADPTKEIDNWVSTQKISPDHVGLPIECIAPFLELAEWVGSTPEDISVVRELLVAVRAVGSPEPDQLLQVFADLGLVQSGDQTLEGVAVTALGRLVARSVL